MLDGLNSYNYIEGGQARTKQEFLADLEQRLPGGSTCDGYIDDGYQIQVWTSDWNPVWVISELCYNGCQPLDPPWNSGKAGFYLTETDEGWTMSAMMLNEPDTFNFGDFDLAACP